MSLIGIEGGVENAKPSRDPSAILSFNWAARRQSQIEKWGPSSVQQKRTWKKDQVTFPVPRYHGAPLFNYWGKDGSFQTKSCKHTYTEKKYSCVRVLVLYFNPQ